MYLKKKKGKIAFLGLQRKDAHFIPILYHTEKTLESSTRTNFSQILSEEIKHKLNVSSPQSGKRSFFGRWEWNAPEKLWREQSGTGGGHMEKRQWHFCSWKVAPGRLGLYCMLMGDTEKVPFRPTITCRRHFSPKFLYLSQCCSFFFEWWDPGAWKKESLENKTGNRGFQNLLSQYWVEVDPPLCVLQEVLDTQI